MRPDRKALDFLRRLGARTALAAEGKMTAKDVARAIKQYKIDVEKSNPVGV